MPKLVRIMKCADDRLPLVAANSNALGVRPVTDIDIDPQGNTVVNHKGMSVYSSWQEIPIARVPKRLGGQGSNSTFVFVFGAGAFQQAVIAISLEFLPDTPTHGIVRPLVTVPLADYETALAATRAAWQIDEA